jgi:hypothetical protein
MIIVAVGLGLVVLLRLVVLLEGVDDFSASWGGGYTDLSIAAVKMMIVVIRIR